MSPGPFAPPVKPGNFKWIRVFEAATSGLLLLGEMYFGVAVLEVKTSPWQNSWFTLIATFLLIIVGPLACLLVWTRDSRNGRLLRTKIHRIEIVGTVVGIVGSVTLMMLMINISFGANH